MIKLVELRWFPYRIPFRSAFLTAHGALSLRSGALVTVETDAGFMGFGEIAPLPEFSGASLDEALRPLSRLAAELRGRELTEILRFLAMQSQDGQLPASLLYGLETALLDASGQALGQSIAELLSRDDPYEHGLPYTPRATIPVNAVISGESIEIAVKRAQVALEAGFTCFKLKVSEASQAMLERVATIRAALGPVPRLRLDANEAWDFEQARIMLRQCAVYDIEYVEQPLPADDIVNMARLRRITPIPLAADEALNSLESARNILRNEAADMLILKPQLLGGLRLGRQIIQEASQQGIGCVITSTLETGIGVAAALHLVAASPEISLACGLATLDLLESDLLQEKLIIDKGQLHLPQGAGLDVRIDWNRLKLYS